MFTSAISRLEHYPSDELGISMGKLLSEVRSYAEQLSTYDTKPFAYRDLTIVVEDMELKHAVELAALRIKPNIPQRRKPERARATQVIPKNN